MRNRKTLLHTNQRELWSIPVYCCFCLASSFPRLGLLSATLLTSLVPLLDPGALVSSRGEAPHFYRWAALEKSWQSGGFGAVLSSALLCCSALGPPRFRGARRPCRDSGKWTLRHLARFNVSCFQFQVPGLRCASVLPVPCTDGSSTSSLEQMSSQTSCRCQPAQLDQYQLLSSQSTERLLMVWHRRSAKEANACSLRNPANLAASGGVTDYLAAPRTFRTLVFVLYESRCCFAKVL